MGRHLHERNRSGRREFLKTAAVAAATPWLYHARLALAADNLGGGLLAPRPTHHAPKARHLIVIFLTG